VRETASPTILGRSRLWRWRMDAGLTLEEVADLVGLSPSMVSRVERGHRQLAAMTKVKIVRRLGVTVRELFEPDDLEGEA
jgi:transcriptional regulator with XRE-family HTH domain